MDSPPESPAKIPAKTPATTESQILTSFLLSRASLPDIITLRAFTDLFPKPLRSNPQVKLLYRELQLQRTQTCERVRKNIQLEVKLGQRQRQDARKRMSDVKGMDGDVECGLELFGASVEEPMMELKETIAALERAVEDMADEFNSLDSQCDEMLEFMKKTIGDLSDLRYGKFAMPGTGEQVVGQLENLHGVCERALGAATDEMEM